MSLGSMLRNIFTMENISIQSGIAEIIRKNEACAAYTLTLSSITVSIKVSVFFIIFLNTFLNFSILIPFRAF